MTAAEIVQGLACGRARCPCAQAATAGHGLTHCPTHEDPSPSLAVDAKGEKTLVKCHAGCSQAQVLEALRARGLWTARRRRQPRAEGDVSSPPDTPARLHHPRGVSLAHYAQAKGLPAEFLVECGLSDTFVGGPVVRIPYYDESGAEVAVRFRIALTGDRFRWKRGSKPCLYGLSRLARARDAGFVVVVEGESDCHVCWFRDVPAVGLPGAANWREEWSAHLDGIPVVYVVLEPDRGGEAVQKWLAESRIRDRARLVRLPDGIKDPAGLHLAHPDPHSFTAAWQAALDAAIPWTDAARADAEAHRRDAWTRCAVLARDPALLDRVTATVERLGVVGEARAVGLLYLATTSRFLQRPVSVAMKGPSSAGKSFVVEQVLALFPPRASYGLSAMSERALAYSKEPLRHRMLVIYEAAGLKGEFATYLVRSLLSEGRIRYETVEKTREGLQPRLIQREGPTGLIVTTTALRLHPENETRLLSVPVTDSPAQTAAILSAQAAEASDRTDLDSWRALQEWLEHAEHRVVIPFARRLAAAIPPVAVRLRRDFPAVLSLVRAHAILHQKTRERDASGRIVATVTDYAAVRDLVHELVADGVEAIVPATIRETVAAVATLIEAHKAEAVSVRQVAAALRLDRSAASRRAQAALERGFVTNLEERKGRPARLVLGDPLPGETDVLPPPEMLDARDPCSSAGVSGGINTPPSPPSGNGAPEEFDLV